MAVHRLLALGLVAVLMIVVPTAGPSSAAATAHVSQLDVVAIVTPVRPYQPGDMVWLTSPPPQEAVGALNDGCQRVPATGYIGTNVYANSTAQYANYWSWSEASSAQPFYWYIKKTDNTTVAFDYSGGGGGSRNVAANVYYWKVQNQGATPQAWNVCYEVR